MKQSILVVISGLALVGAQGCGADSTSESGADEADIRASVHGKAIITCQEAENEATLRDQSATSRLAATKKLKACMAAANDRTLRQIDVRRGSSAPVTHVQFAAYRADFTAACEAYFSVHPGGIVPRNSATCGADAEYNLARLLQNDGNLGGTPEMTLQFAPWRSVCLQGSSVPQMRACVEAEVKAQVAGDRATVQRAYSTALDGGNRALCEALAKRRGQSMDERAADQCRMDAAFLLRSITPS